jgi:hypothetical protein
MQSLLGCTVATNTVAPPPPVGFAAHSPSGARSAGQECGLGGIFYFSGIFSLFLLRNFAICYLFKTAGKHKNSLLPPSSLGSKQALA